MAELRSLRTQECEGPPLTASFDFVIVIAADRKLRIEGGINACVQLVFSLYF